jgi:hypothetical protein
MTFKPAIWKPVAIVVSAANLVGVGFAAAAAEPYHAGVHAALALAFGLWAQRLRPLRDGGDREERMDEFEADVSDLRRQLTETQERVDFAERMLAQVAESRRLDAEH